MISRSLFGKFQKNLLIPVVIILITILTAPLAPMSPYAAWAGEGGSSTYTPGTNAWSMGVMPPPGLYFRYIFVFYEGRADAVVESGEIQLNARIRLMGNLLLPIVVTPSGYRFPGRRPGVYFLHYSPGLVLYYLWSRRCQCP